MMQLKTLGASNENSEQSKKGKNGKICWLFCYIFILCIIEILLKQSLQNLMNIFDICLCGYYIAVFSISLTET